VWIRGGDVLVLDQGTGQPFQPGGRARPVDLGPLGQGEALLDLRSSEVRTTDEAGYVRLFGTLLPDELAAIARTLRQHT
jgi:hypothetical protein